MRRAVVVFLLVAFGFSWSACEIYYRVIGASLIGDRLIGLVFMGGPALGAIAATRFVLRERISWPGPLFAFNAWLLAAIGLPFLFAACYVAISPLLPGLTHALDADSLGASILASIPVELHAVARAQMAEFGAMLPWVYLAQVVLGGLVAGLTVNAITAFGEEWGWRGFLHRAWQSWDFWSRAAVIGVLWGLWHAPLILRGHNFPEHPQTGAAVMVLFCLLWAPIFEHVRERAGCVLAAVLMHGMMNATAGASLFVAGGNDLLRGPAGAAGCLVLVAGCAWVYFDRRSRDHGRA